MGLFNKTTTNRYVEKSTNKHDVEIAKAQAEASKSGDRVYAEANIQKEHADDLKERPWAHDNLFYSHYQMMRITFPNTEENITKTVERLLNENKRILNTYQKVDLSMAVGPLIKFMIFGWVGSMTKIIQAFIGEPHVCKEASEIINKASEGISKLNHLNPDYNTGYLMQLKSETSNLTENVKNKTKKVFTIKLSLVVIFWTAFIIAAIYRR